MLKQFLILALFALVLFFPFLGSTHLFDWDEINFAESAREMLVTGDFFRVQINYEPFWEKPPLFFWLQAACMKIFGVGEFAARLPNAICGLITLLVIFDLGRRLFSTRFAWLWVLFVTGSLTPHLYFQSGIIDPVFNLFIFLSLVQFWTSLDEKKLSLHHVLMGLFAGLAVLTKGPVAVLIILLCVLVFWLLTSDRKAFHWKGLLVAGCVATVVSSVWVMAEIFRNGPGVLLDFIVYQAELFGKDVSAHTQPWFYHPLVLLFGAFPASLFAIRGFTLPAPPQRYVANFRIILHVLFWVVLILFSISKTKIVHYSSLCYLPLTFSAAYAALHFMSHNRIHKVIIISIVAFGCLLGVAIGALPFLLEFLFHVLPSYTEPALQHSIAGGSTWNGLEFLVALVWTSLLVIFAVCAWREQVWRATMLLLVSFSFFISFLVIYVAPRVEPYSQGYLVRAYESLQDEDCYIETVGFKSYAQYFYSRVRPHTNPLAGTRAWLMEGEIDKPAYFMMRSREVEQFRHVKLTKVWEEGGYVLMKREVPK
jgi:4-amino-4-deoxy-L-arabinose transferase-like glycosyltransferase